MHFFQTLFFNTLIFLTRILNKKKQNKKDTYTQRPPIVDIPTQILIFFATTTKPDAA